MQHKQSETFVYQAVLSGELQIDDQGRIWRVMKRLADRWTEGTRTVPCKRVRAETGFGTQNYLQVRVMRDGKRHYAAAHRVAWIHFNGAIPQGMTVNHKKGNKKDNRPSELELATYPEQRRHALDVLGVNRNHPTGSKHPKTHLTEADVVKIRERRANGEQVKVIAKDYRMNPKAVSAICRRRTWLHI